MMRADTRQTLGDLAHALRSSLSEGVFIMPIAVFRESRADAGQPDLFPEAPADALVRVSGPGDHEAELM